MEEWLRRKFEGIIKKTSRLTKEDLRMVGGGGDTLGEGDRG